METEVEFKVLGNIDYKAVNDFVEFYELALSEKQKNKNIQFRISIELANDSINDLNKSKSGEVDLIYLGYIALFLSDFLNSSIKFNFIDSSNYRDWCLKHQLEHIRYIITKISNNKFSQNQISISNQNKKVYLFKYNNIDRKTGEILSEDSAKLQQSGSFIPPLFISKNNNLNYFEKLTDQNKILFPIYKKYLTKIKSEVVKLIYPSPIKDKEEKRRMDEKKNNYLTKLKLNELSFIEITIFRLLTNSNLYSSRTASTIKNKPIYQQNRERIKDYKIFTKSLSGGIKELSKNIIEHSSTQKGIITIRLFEKEQLLNLKNNILDFINNRNNDEYKIIRRKRRVNTDGLSVKLNDKDIYDDVNNSYFLDINIIDFGQKSIRETYIDNLNNNLESKNSEISTADIENDILLIKNNNKFKFEDFFNINIDTFSQLTHQQDTLISRIGLQYFTSTLKDNHNAYVKASSSSSLNKSSDKNISSEEITFFNTNEAKKNPIKFKKDIENTVKSGTTYNCIVPIHTIPIYRKTTNETENLNYKHAPNVNIFHKLQNYKITEKYENSHTLLLYTIDNEKLDRYEGKYEKISYIYNNIKHKYLKNKENILIINSNKLPTQYPIRMNGSDWVRLLSALNFYFKNIIVYNIEHSKVSEFYDQRLTRYNSNPARISFWSKEDSRILFYSCKKDNNNHKKHRATLFSGEHHTDFLLLNLYININHLTTFQRPKTDEDINYENIKKLTKNPLFLNNNLQYFELLIENKIDTGGKLSLFEESIQHELHIKLTTKEQISTGFLSGNTHFRLGSKIHINNFYYAKKIFQNSFYTTPLAYKLADYIYPLLENNKNYSLVGYEYYSDFLLSTTRNLIQHKLSRDEKYPDLDLNHIILNKENKFSRGVENVNDNILIIVPIASTFSTSVKIKNNINAIFARYNKKYKKEIKNKIIEKKRVKIIDYISIILVGHKDKDGKTFEEFFDDQQLNQFNVNLKDDNNILSDFNWVSINKHNKIISIKEHKNDKTRSQKYFIPVYTTWQKAQECTLCFSNKIKDERCLIETGIASITPKVIFGYPKTKHSKNNNQLDLSKSLLYGNLLRNNNNYLYYTKNGTVVNHFITDEKKEKDYTNRKKINSWLNKTVKKKFERYKNKAIVIVTPTSSSKSNFLDLVNEHVFGFTAHCLFISIAEDYIENADTLYADALTRSDIVVYVDDVLSTVKSFLEVNYIVKYILGKSYNGRGIDYCISLINRMTYDCENNLLLKLVPLINNDCKEIIDAIDDTRNLQKSENNKYKNRITENKNKIYNISKKLQDKSINFEATNDRLLYFTRINNPSIDEPNNEFPLEKERKKYKKLANISSLDSIREYFNNHKNHLNQHDLAEGTSNRIIDFKHYNNRKLFQLLVLDSLYMLFEYDNKKYINYNTKKQIFKSTKHSSKDFLQLIEFVNDKLKTKHSIHKNIIDKYRGNISYVLLKIICSTPLIYYKNIRLSAFSWINNLLCNEFYKIKGYHKKGNIEKFFKINKNNYSDFNNFEFLLKRSVKLKGNLIIHPEFFKVAQILIDYLHSNNQILNKIENIFNSVVAHIEALSEINELDKLKKYIIRIKICFSYDRYNELIDIIENKKSKTNQQQGFDRLDENLLNKNYIEETSKNLYIYTTSKKFIHYLLALVKELILDHGTKSQQLEKNIKEEITKEQNFHNNNENGNFQHYLRLLKLENTAVIANFWSYYKKNESLNNHESINEELNRSEFNNDPKYQHVKNFVIDDKDISIFIKIRANIYNRLNSNEPKGVTDFISDNVLHLISEILGIENVQQAFLTLNHQYNDTKSDISVDNSLYKFEWKANNKSKVFILDDLKNSLTFDIFEDIGIKNNDNKSAKSNLEIYKKEANIYFRKDLFNIKDSKEIDVNMLSRYQELNKLKNSTEYRILFVKISDFYTDVSKTEKLSTQGVLTILLRSNNRIPEEKLRLILLLRNPLSKLLKKEISTSAFSEIIKNKRNEEFSSSLQHSLKTYLRCQVRIIDAINKQGSNNESLTRVYKLVNNCIGAQITAGQKKFKTIKYQKGQIKQYIEDILNTQHLASRSINKNMYSIKINNSEISMNSSIYEIIIPELLINIKKYSPTISKNIEINISYEDNKFIFKNKYSEAKVKSSKTYGNRKGIEMCQEIIKKINKSPDCKVLLIPKKPNKTKKLYTIELMT